jgi:hypothetical protein
MTTQAVTATTATLQWTVGRFLLIEEGTRQDFKRCVLAAFCWEISYDALRTPKSGYMIPPVIKLAYTSTTSNTDLVLVEREDGE